MKNFFICDFFDFSRKFFKAFFAFFVLFFLNFSTFAKDVYVYYRWTPYPDSAGTWDGDWSVTYKDGGISKAKFWSYWKKSEPNWEKTFNNTGGTADYPGYYPDPNQKKLAYTYFTGEHAVTATLDSSPANELEELHIGDCYNSKAAGSSVGTEKITINLSGADLKAKTLVLGSSSASVPSVKFALTGVGTLKVSEEMSFAAAPGVSCTYNIEVGTGTVLDVSSVELNDSRLTVNFTGDGTLKVGKAIFSAGKINIKVKNLEISGTFKNEAGSTLSVSGLSSGSRKFVGDFENAGTAEFSGESKNTFGGAVTNSGSVKFKDSAEGTFNGTFENSRTAEFSGGSKSRFVGAVTNSGSVEFKDSAEGTFSGTVTNATDGTFCFSSSAIGAFAQDFTNNAGGTVSFAGTAKGTFSSAFSNSGVVDLKNASSQIKFDRNFTNNQGGTVTLPDSSGASVSFGTGTATFSNKGTVYSSGLCTTVAFANPVTVTDSGTWIYTGGTTPGEVILKNISYNILILRGNLEVPGNLTANVIRVETDSLKIKGIISSDSIDVKTDKPIELTGKLTVGSAAFRLSENTDFQINKYELVFGTDAKKCAITSGAEKKLSFFGTAGSKINFYSASLDIIGDFYSEPDVLFNCDVHASEINTSGKQEYFGAVTVAGAAKTKFNASAVTFLGTTYIQNETEISATGAVAFSGDVKVSAGSASILADTVFSGDCNISVASGQFSIGDSTSPKNTVVETSKNVKFKDISDGCFYGKFNNSGNVSFENCGNIKIWGDSVNSGGFLCSGISDLEISGTFENAGTAEFSGRSKSSFVGAVTNSGLAKFKDSAEGTFSSAFSNAGTVDLKNASSQIKFDGNFTNNKDGTVTLPDSFGASVSFETRTATFSNLGTVYSSGLCAVAFANPVTVTNGGKWVYTGGTTPGKVILAGDISYNVLILKGNLEVPGNLTATNILVETKSLKIHGEISSEQVSLNTDNPIELDSDENIDSKKIVLLKNAKFNLKGHKLVFGKAGAASLISNAAVNGLNLILSDSPLPSQGKVFFYSSVGTESARLAEIVSDADLEFFSDVHAKSLAAKKDAEIHTAEINTTGKQEYSGAVTVSGAAKTKFNASAVNFHGTTDIQNETEVSASGAVAFSGAVTTSAKTGITATTGAVRFEKPVEAGDEFSVNADSAGGSVTFSDTVKFSGKTSLSSSSGQVHFGSTLETSPGAQVSVASHSAVFEKTLTLKDWLSVKADLTAGTAEFKEAVVSTSKIEVSAKTASFNSAVSAGDSISVQNAETAVFASSLSAGTFISVKSGVSTFASSVTAANSISVEGAEATFSGDVKVSAGALSVIAEKSFFRSDVNVSGNVNISGTAASVQFDSDFIISGISVFNADVYFSAKRKNDVEIRTEKISVGSENSEKNLYVSAVDDAAASAKNISWRTPADVSGNFVLLNGNITLSNNPSGKTPDISAGKDIVLLNGDSSSMYNDSVSADFNWRSDAEGIFKYSERKNSNAVFPDAFPDGTKVSSEKFISSLSGLGNGVTLSAGKNFYCNGVNLKGDSAWNLKAGNNGNSENFAEAYASSIKNCNFSSSGNGISFLSAAESFDKTGNNKNVCFGHPEIALARTVYDDVIEVSFKDSVSGKPVKIENSNNEIWKNIAENSTFLTYENNGSKISFTGTFVDAECTESTDGEGDLEKFFIKAPESWNTDATGKSPGAAQSTDMNGIHRSAVPYLNIVRAVSGNLQGLRDEHKNRIASYDGAAKRFDSVTDSCPPVLLAVRTGQELHEKLPEKQKTHDSHNFLEFQYSEEIFVNGGDSSVVNVQSSAELAGILNSSENGILVSGLAQFESGKVSLGSESGIAPEKLNSIYRNFAVSLSKGESPQTHRFRISLAGYQSQTAAENSSGYPYWPGYIDSKNTQMPSGEITLVPHGNQPSAENQKFNDFIKDSEGNSLLVKSQENHPLKNLSVISDSSGDIYNPDWNDSVYGIWDLSAPVFAVYRSFNSNGVAKSSESYEILGACKTSGTFLDRIEFHVFDNSEDEYFGGAKWFSQFGWGKDKNTLFAEDSYASDIFGGSRPFGNSPGGSARTSGGIRYSTLYNKSSYFNYGVDYETPASEFKNSRIESGAFSTLFLSKIGDKREISSGDSLYFSVFLKDGTKLPLKTNFSIKYDQQGCVTDLAGNLMKSAEAKSVDRVSPRFNMTSAKVSGNKLYVVFNKEINLEPVELEFSDGTKKSFGISDSLRFIKIPADGHKFEASSDVVSDLSIEKETAPLKTYSSGNFTGLIFTLNRNVTLEDVKNYYIQSFSPESGKFIDPFTGIKDVKVTAITDMNGNYMSHGDAHALSDFAVDVVNPVYAYDDRFMEEKFGFSASAAAQSNLSVREWDEDQQKDGTLLTEHNLFVVTSQDSGNSEDAESLPEKIIMYYDKSPDSDSVSKEYNKNLEQNLRVWIPSLVPVDTSGSSTERISSLTALASATNSNNLFAAGEVSKNIAKFTLDWETMEKNGYSSGNQVSFLFGLAETDGSPVKICHAPSYDEITGVYRLEPQPLFALRLKNSNDPVSLDLWSFRLKSAVLQRGNVTIFNNVIDVNKGEMSVVRVNMPSEGKLDVIVMTLDGNIIRYLQHGTASAGEHNYSWNGTSKSGKKVARGLYFVRVFGNGIDETRKIMVVKN